MALAAIALAAWSGLGAGCKPEVRCDAARAKTCPSGLEKSSDTMDSQCEARYDGECGSEWADYVSCVADSEPTCYDRANNKYTHQSTCFGAQFHTYAACQCKYETQKGGSSPWCGF
jgi:hypothetical protein